MALTGLPVEQRGGRIREVIDTPGGDCYYSQPEVNAPSAGTTALRGRTLFQRFQTGTVPP
ncbi:hypothetical protein GCM10008960_00010 [Deinococcus sedimenti]|uniref:Uncharacterized protein n=1 Tax=Deinococcus sedimenti TaxID=1867090 RepID=A0ABQ2S0U3_9DEIO|nr:hypothetical protein GCM10008960_00010 [Deinococcus sedimenti]